MKKFSVASVVVGSFLVSGLAFAAATAITSGGTINATACPALTSDASVKITLSTSNVGAYECQATGAAIGVAVGNSAGKGNVYSVGSGGGSVTTTTGVTDYSGVAATQASARMTEAAST
jgi:hypothetical protein